MVFLKIVISATMNPPSAPMRMNGLGAMVPAGPGAERVHENHAAATRSRMRKPVRLTVPLIVITSAERPRTESVKTLSFRAGFAVRIGRNNSGGSSLDKTFIALVDAWSFRGGKPGSLPGQGYRLVSRWNSCCEG